MIASSLAFKTNQNKEGESISDPPSLIKILFQIYFLSPVPLSLRVTS